MRIWRLIGIIISDEIKIIIAILKLFRFELVKYDSLGSLARAGRYNGYTWVIIYECII
jgi:hypothetical protein